MTGGRYRVDRYKKAPKGEKPRTSLVFVTEWTDEDSAVAFLNAYQSVLEKKWKHVDKGDQDATHSRANRKTGITGWSAKGRLCFRAKASQGNSDTRITGSAAPSDSSLSGPYLSC